MDEFRLVIRGTIPSEFAELATRLRAQRLLQIMADWDEAIADLLFAAARPSRDANAIADAFRALAE